MNYIGPHFSKLILSYSSVRALKVCVLSYFFQHSRLLGVSFPKLSPSFWLLKFSSYEFLFATNIFHFPSLVMLYFPDVLAFFKIFLRVILKFSDASLFCTIFIPADSYFYFLCLLASLIIVFFQLFLFF